MLVIDFGWFCSSLGCLMFFIVFHCFSQKTVTKWYKMSDNENWKAILKCNLVHICQTKTIHHGIWWNIMKYYSISMYIQTMTNYVDACLPYPIHLLDRTKMVLVAPMAICSGPSHARSTIIAFWKLSTVGLASNRMRSTSLTLILWLLAVQLQIGKGFLHFVVLRQAHANPSGSSPWCLSKQRTSLQLPWGDWMATWCHSISHLCVIDCNVSVGRVFDCFWLCFFFGSVWWLHWWKSL